MTCSLSLHQCKITTTLPRWKSHNVSWSVATYSPSGSRGLTYVRNVSARRDYHNSCGARSVISTGSYAPPPTLGYYRTLTCLEHTSSSTSTAYARINCGIGDAGGPYQGVNESVHRQRRHRHSRHLAPVNTGSWRDVLPIRYRDHSSASPEYLLYQAYVGLSSACSDGTHRPALPYV